MSPFGRRGNRQRALAAAERWAQAVRDGQARLDSFTQAELDCVMLGPESQSAKGDLPQLQQPGPLLSALAEHPGCALPPVTAHAGLAPAAAGLRRRGDLRPGQPSTSPAAVPVELAGWSADPDGGRELRPVTIVGDLGIIIRARDRPWWVVEVAEPGDQAGADPASGGWRLVARMHSTRRPEAGVVEFPPGRDRSLPPCSLLFQERSVWALWVWAAIDLDEMRYESNPEFVESAPSARTNDLIGEFASIRRLRAAHLAGERVAIRTLVAAAADRKHWVLVGDHGERADLVSVNQLGERIQSLIQPVEPTGDD